MALLHATHKIWPEGNGRIAVAHVDHQLRGAESRADADFVENSARDLGLRFILLSCDVPMAREEQGGSVEELARQYRYELLADAADRMNFGSVVCGHHRNDQAETILHNIIRGTGLKGVAGMAATRPLSSTVQLLRPMLNIARADAETWLQSQQLEWRHDVSNLSPDFTRNRIRNELLPLMAESCNPEVVDSLLRLAEHARNADQLSDEVAQRCLDDVILELQPGICRIDRTRLAHWPESVIRSALRLIWSQQSWPQQRMTQTHWNLLAANFRSPERVPQDVPGLQVSATTTIVRIFEPT